MKKVLIVDTPGIGLRLSSERISFLKGGRVEEIPLKDLEEVRISRGVSLTSDVLLSLVSHGVIVTFIDERGTPEGLLIVPTSGGTVKTRREQIRSYEDRRGVLLAKRFVESATLSRSWLLKRLARHRPEVSEKLKKVAGLIEEIYHEIEELDGEKIDEMRQDLLALEGRASSKYFEALSSVVPQEFFSGIRTRRPPRDPFNAAISYANSMVYSETLKCVVFSGLDPFAGFLHVDRPGRFSLALDLAEEFVIYVSHRPAINLFSRHSIGLEHFRGSPEQGVYLNYEGKRKVSRAVTTSLLKSVPYQGKRWRVRDLILLRARGIVSFVRRESEIYPLLVPWE